MTKIVFFEVYHCFSNLYLLVVSSNLRINKLQYIFGEQKQTCKQSFMIENGRNTFAAAYVCPLRKRKNKQPLLKSFAESIKSIRRSNGPSVSTNKAFIWIYEAMQTPLELRFEYYMGFNFLWFYMKKHLNVKTTLTRVFNTFFSQFSQKLYQITFLQSFFTVLTSP